jgi:transposase InsO family protein
MGRCFSLARRPIADESPCPLMAQMRSVDRVGKCLLLGADRTRAGDAVTKRLAAMGIRDHPIAPRSPWQNGHAERLIGSIRRECLDHVVVFGEAHLRRILAAYTGYYNELRTHLSLDKDSPGRRPIQRFGQLVARPILGGLHHQYCRT